MSRRAEALRVVAEALYGKGAGDFSVATGFTVLHESRQVVAALEEAGLLRLDEPLEVVKDFPSDTLGSTELEG